MVLPYLKGLIVMKIWSFIFNVVIYWAYISISIHFLVRSTTSGIRALSWAEFGDFLFFSFFCRNFLGGEFVEKIWKIWWNFFRNKYQIWIPYGKIPNFKKKNQSNRSPDEGVITDLKSTIFSEILWRRDSCSANLCFQSA